MKLFIPWHTFFVCLQKQPVASREKWLAYYAFDDRGVELIPEVAISKETLRSGILREKQERAILATLVEQYRARTTPY